MAGKIVNGIVFNNPNAAAELSFTEKVYKKNENLYDLKKLIDRYREQLRPEFNVVVQSEVKSK